VLSEAKTIWQTAGTHAARNLERDILFIKNRLCVAVFAEGLSAVEDRVSLFSVVAKKRLVEENQQAITTLGALKEWSQSTIKRWDN